MIYLKKLEIYGFKSFADKLELRFDQSITGIVGPNGCGKSNVSDAIRWVLGEQSTKMLRGKSMQDIIFAGTDSRKSMSYCEVSLFLDNATRIFPIEMDEIIISRKLYRNGDSEYLLNKNIVRLKDIQELLRSVGLGKEGYSIVGQGRMDAILNARPEDRRAIFEEALGISRFRVKKVETERKLEKTKINMDTLNVLATELERQIAPLTKQAAAAKKYLEIRDQLRYHEINSYIYNYDNSSVMKDSCRKKLEGLQEEYSLRESQYAEVNETYDRLFHEINNIDATLSQLNEQRLTLAIDIERQSGDKKLIAERHANVNAEIDKNNETIAQLNADIQELDQKVVDGQTILANRREELVALEVDLQSNNENFADLSHEVDSIRSNITSIQSQLESVTQQLSQCTVDKASNSAEMAQHKSRLAQIDEQMQKLTAKLSQLSGEEGKLLARYDQSRNQRTELSANIEQLSAKIKNQEYEIFEHNKVLLSAQQQLASEKGSIELLSDFANNYKGYQVSVQSLMHAAKTDSQLASRIKGVVANLIKTDERLVVAIETALSNRLQNIVTANEEDAQYLINHLKANNYGRATFLPMTSMKSRHIDRAEILKEHGVLDLAVNLVTYDKQYDGVMQSLLGGIIIVDSYENAIRLSRKYGYVHRMVTLAGERISVDGSIEGGASKSNKASLLSYESQLSARRDRLITLTAQLEQIQSDHKEMTDTLSDDKRQLSAWQKQLGKLEVDIATDRERIESSSIINNSDKQSIMSLQEERYNIDNRLEVLRANIDNHDKVVSKLSLDETELKIALTTQSQLLDSKTSARDTLNETISSKRYRLGTLKSNIDLSSKAIDGYLIDIHKLQSTLEQRVTYGKQLVEASQLLGQSLEQDGNSDARQSRLEELTEAIRSTDQIKLDLNTNFQMISNQRTQLSGELESLRGAIDKEEYILVKIDEDLMLLQQRVQEEYDITYSAAMEYKDENYDPSNSKELIGQLRMSMQRLGYVNVNAIEELETVKTRFGGIDEQLEDLRRADKDLREILKQLTTEIQSRFEVGMEQINENFKQVFRELFNGGNAKLSLDKDENKDVLDYGVDIEAQPPGKRLQNISLLSGGERTLTAAAILFAILKLSPMPFCVLDEIEAALDDSNAFRIAKYLRNFAESTQFIVITHKKPTMENADVLYGVTMEEKGVSKVVSVKLNDAIATAS